MLTYALSPARRVGLIPGRRSDRPTRSCWMKLGCGERVREPDGRHVGRVEAIHNSAVVKVRWDNGWVSELPLCDLERVS